VTSPRATRPVLAAPREPLLPPVEEFALRSGVRVFVVRRPELPVVDVRIVVRAGAELDEPALAGRAHLTAELLDEGTETRSSLAIADETDLLGASLHVRANWDAAELGLHVLAPRLGPALDIAADCVLRPVFADDEFERRRTQRLGAIVQDRDDPRILASQTFARVVYGDDHPYGSPVGGTRASIEALSPDHVRGFYRERYRPGEAFIVVAGDVDPDTLAPLLDSHFGDWQCSTPATPRRSTPATAAAPGIHLVHRPGAPQSELRVGLAGPPRSTADYFPLLVGNTVLGGSFMSRLNILLRQEKAYTYGAGTHFAFRAGGGPFLATTAVDTAATADAVNDMVEQTALLAAEPVPVTELERAKSYIMLGLPRSLETTADIAEHVSEVALYGLGRDWLSSYASRVRAVTAGEVQEAAARWLKRPSLTVVVVGDAAEVRAGLEDLRMGAVHERDAG
jgi:zinc protease